MGKQIRRGIRHQQHPDDVAGGQKREAARVFLCRNLFLGVFDSRQTVLSDVTPDEVPGCHRHALEYARPDHLNH